MQINIFTLRKEAKDALRIPLEELKERVYSTLYFTYRISYHLHSKER
jgi:hypothetical protein